MNTVNNFDKKTFSNVLSEIYNQYSNQRSFAKKANINRTYISRYINQRLEMPPSATILRRLANASKGLTTYQELMQICGYLEENETIVNKRKGRLEQILELANGLTIQEANYLIKQLNKSKIQIEKGEWEKNE